MLRMTDHRDLERLKQALETQRRALEELEAALLDFETVLDAHGEASVGDAYEKGSDRGSSQLLSIAEVCQELAMGKSWVHRRLRSGEIPSVRLGRSIKVKRADLDEYLEGQRYRPPQEWEASKEDGIK